MEYGISKTLALSFEEAVDRVTEELKRQGFGVLTTIDVKDTLKKKLGVDFGNYVILGACNPPLSYRALQAEEAIGLLLPCNVIVYERHGKTVVSAFDPIAMLSIVENEMIRPIAEEARKRLQEVIRAV